MLVQIEGCEYRVSKEQIMTWLEYYGELISDLQEETYVLEDEDKEGVNRTGSYCVKMMIHRDIPQLLPMWVRRIKIYYTLKERT